MAASYVVQPHRFDIAQGLGCFSQPYPVLAAVFLVQIWPVIFSLVSSAYGGKSFPPELRIWQRLNGLLMITVIAISAFLRRRLHFSTVLKSNNSGLTTSRYVRLAGLAISDLLIALPLALYFLVVIARNLEPWISFDWIHLDFNTVVPRDEVYMARNPEFAIGIFLPRWLAPLSAITFFGFFGLAEDVLADYVALWSRLQKRLTARVFVGRSVPE